MSRTEEMRDRVLEMGHRLGASLDDLDFGVANPDAESSAKQLVVRETN